MSVGDNGVVTSPVQMWLRATDALLDELRDTGLLDRVACVSCSGQQHGSVYWSQLGLDALANPHATATGFADALSNPGCFALGDSPIWADSSTKQVCEEIEETFATTRKTGAAAVATLTGSRAYARFTGPQIAAVHRRAPSAWGNTARVSVVSSFCAALLTGRHQPVDHSDGAGTLLMALGPKKWSDKMLKCKSMPPNLEEKLGGAPVAAHTILGDVSKFVARRWGLPSECKVAASSGDNPCALAGLGLAQPGDLALSLGTSDTLLGIMPAEAATPAIEGNIMPHPADPASVFGMLCYQNGGATRQAVRDSRCKSDWSVFDRMLKSVRTGHPGLSQWHTSD
jgi:xylulokinase